MPAADTISTSATGSRLVDPGALMRIRSLELRARMVVEGFWHGIHRSPYHGFSVEFTEYRQFTPDDDPRHLDWRVFARSDRLFIKKFEDETNARCYLMPDSSRSMSFGSTGFSKADYAATLAATFAYFLYLQGDAIGLMAFDEKVRDFLPARHRTGHLRRVMLALETPPAGRATDLAAPLRAIADTVRKRSLIVFLSDFLAPLDRVESDLISLNASGHDLILFQILDPAELKFEFDSPMLFEDAESGRTLFIDPGQARKEYGRRFQAHCDALEATCRRLGIPCIRLLTDRPLELALFDFLRERMGRRRFSRRIAAGSRS
jgi:uncharacterized protein (DUF58 family)